MALDTLLVFMDGCKPQTEHFPPLLSSALLGSDTTSDSHSTSLCSSLTEIPLFFGFFFGRNSGL